MLHVACCLLYAVTYAITNTHSWHTRNNPQRALWHAARTCFGAAAGITSYAIFVTMDVYRMIMDYLAAHAAHDDKAKPLTLPRKVFQLTRTRLAVIGVRLCVVVAITIYACVIRVQMGGKAPKFEKRDSHLYYIEPPLSKALTRAYVYSALRCCAGRGVQTVRLLFAAHRRKCIPKYVIPTDRCADSGGQRCSQQRNGGSSG